MSATPPQLSKNALDRNRLVSLKMGLGRLTGELMQISAFMSRNIGVCTPQSSCTRAGDIMLRLECGFLAVVDSLKTRRIIGLVTDRDIMLHLVGSGIPPGEAEVRDCMTTAPTMITADADLDVAVRVMKKEALYQLPVTEKGRLVGVISLEDVARAARRQWAHKGPHMTEQHVSEIIEAIASARAHRNKPSRHRKPRVVRNGAANGKGAASPAAV